LRLVSYEKDAEIECYHEQSYEEVALYFMPLCILPAPIPLFPFDIRWHCCFFCDYSCWILPFVLFLRIC